MAKSVCQGIFLWASLFLTKTENTSLSIKQETTPVAHTVWSQENNFGVMIVTIEERISLHLYEYCFPNVYIPVVV